jgi:hypothetical protein
MDEGEQAAETEVTAGGKATETVAVPDLLELAVEVAVMVAGPAAAGVKTPAEVMVPLVAVQETVEA